ncbi:MAG: putative aminoacid/polyamine transporter, permease protein [Rhodospirillales bacterium]|nr:putative aminoacid/polyamine transporter, permease protein [Rhodospirillales bacterium]
MSFLRLLLGRPLANREQSERKLGPLEGVPAMGLDGLSSSAYGPEAALTVLIPAGAAALAWLGWVMAPILALLAILYVSYRQTIRAYPANGGAYTVSKENLGAKASLLAAAALMIDYVLNVAVGISAGVAALVSAVPALHAWMLTLCLAVLALITIINLRGTLDAGRVFAPPTYIFVASFLVLLAIGVSKTIASGGHPEPVVPPPALPEAVETVGLWLLLRSFAAGCTAMTGVEAVSNGVSAFREPVVKNAHRTLGIICAILGILLAGIAYLVQAYGILAMDQTQEGYQSVLSQLAGAVVGRGWFYYVAIGSVLTVLCLSANTSFVDFPRLCHLVAQDDYLPRPFAVVGRRLVFSVGILYLAATAAILLIVFGGITDRLIPLFAIGAFLTFTMSQTGMVVHWRRELRTAQDARERHFHRVRLAINAVGATTTALALAIIIAAKFTEGAWITILVIPCVILLLQVIKRYYDELDARLRKDGPLSLVGQPPPIVLITTEGWNRLTDKALAFALSLSPDVIAVHLTKLDPDEDEEKDARLRRQWEEDVEAPAREAGLRPPKLVMIQAPYRRFRGPLLNLIERLEAEHPSRTIAVLIPEVVKRHWWQHLLHTHRARRLANSLLHYGGSRLAVMIVPWYLEEPKVEEAVEPEEAADPEEAVPIEMLEAAGDKPEGRR